MLKNLVDDKQISTIPVLKKRLQDFNNKEEAACKFRLNSTEKKSPSPAPNSATPKISCLQLHTSKISCLQLHNSKISISRSQLRNSTIPYLQLQNSKISCLQLHNSKISRFQLTTPVSGLDNLEPVKEDENISKLLERDLRFDNPCPNKSKHTDITVNQLTTRVEIPNYLKNWDPKNPDMFKAKPFFVLFESLISQNGVQDQSKDLLASCLKTPFPGYLMSAWVELSYEEIKNYIMSRFHKDIPRVQYLLEALDMRQKENEEVRDFYQRVVEAIDHCQYDYGFSRDQVCVILQRGIHDQDLAKQIENTLDGTETRIESILSRAMSRKHKSSKNFQTSSYKSSSYGNLDPNTQLKGNKNSACHSCGDIGHFRASCKFYNAVCDSCGKSGHISKVCKIRKFQNGGNERVNSCLLTPLSIPSSSQKYGFEKVHVKKNTPFVHSSKHTSDLHKSCKNSWEGLIETKNKFFFDPLSCHRFCSWKSY